MPGDYIEENLPTNFKPNSPYIVSPFDGKLQSQLLPIECDTVGQKIRIANTSEKSVNLEKKSQAFQVHPLHTDLPEKIKEHTPHQDYRRRSSGSKTRISSQTHRSGEEV